MALPTTSPTAKITLNQGGTPVAFGKGFWSYVHADEEAEGGRIARLARDVRDQFQVLTSEPLELFLDRDPLSWGDAWRDKIDSNLASVAFFIPVLTPRYFMSPECAINSQGFDIRRHNKACQILSMGRLARTEVHGAFVRGISPGRRQTRGAIGGSQP